MEKGIVKPGIIVHHKVYLTPTNINNPDVTLNWDNLQLLCIDCHNKEHSKELPIGEGLMFDAEGNLVKIISPPVMQNDNGSGDRERYLQKPRNGHV